MGDLALRPEYALSLEQMTGQVATIQEVMGGLMKSDTHYGVIPGTPKPTLYKPGAEMLCMVFRLAPVFEHVREWDGPHLTVYSRCTLVHIPTGASWGTGEGSCSTKESKYAWRKGERRCPDCDAATIIKGKKEYGGGWLCFAKKGGCGAKFRDGDQAIEGQSVERVPNPDIADQYNTVLKMANKRAHVAATLVVTAASDMFTQDIEDLPEFQREPAPEQKREEPRNVTPPPCWRCAEGHVALKSPRGPVHVYSNYPDDFEVGCPDPVKPNVNPPPAQKPDPALELLPKKRNRWECHPRLLSACKERAAEIGVGDRERTTKAGSRIGDAIERAYGPLPEIPEGDKLEGAIEMASDFER